MRNHAVLPALGLLAGFSVLAGELTPYPSPAQQAPVLVPQVIYKSRPAPAPRPPQSIYERFQEDVRGLSPKERQALARNFEQSRTAAALAGDDARELHYLRLLEVLRGEGGRR